MDLIDLEAVLWEIINKSLGADKKEIKRPELLDVRRGIICAAPANDQFNWWHKFTQPCNPLGAEHKTILEKNDVGADFLQLSDDNIPA